MTLSITPDQDEIPTVESGVVVWHRRHLRTSDHPAVTYATNHYDAVIPVFIFDPGFYSGSGLACDSRISFLHDCLRDLNNQYERVDSAITYAYGDPIDVLTRFTESGWDIVATADPTSRYGWQRDNEAAATCDVAFIDDDGLVRNTDNTRDGWSDHVKNWMTDDPHTFDPTETTIKTISTPITPAKLTDEYSIIPQKTDVPRGGRKPGKRRLKHFTRNISDYPGSISAPIKAEHGTSRLSTYLRFGCVSVREAYQYVTENATDDRAVEMFTSRLFWNRHYNQKLEDWPGWMRKAVNPALTQFHADTHDPELVNAWKHGETGFPMVDASMRCLKQTGWLNFRMRAMCASFLCDLLQQPWRIGADWFYYHLIDADPAINYTQFQSQAGVVGVNMERVYNPRKQVRDNDPDGEFISKWVPELADLPVSHLDQPEKTPVATQQNCGVRIGDDYPYPVVEYEKARERIYRKIEQVKSTAESALANSEVARRASLSRRGGQQSLDDANQSDQSTQTAQSSLAEF